MATWMNEWIVLFISWNSLKLLSIAMNPLPRRLQFTLPLLHPHFSLSAVNKFRNMLSEVAPILPAPLSLSELPFLLIPVIPCLNIFQGWFMSASVDLRPKLLCWNLFDEFSDMLYFDMLSKFPQLLFLYLSDISCKIWLNFSYLYICLLKINYSAVKRTSCLKNKFMKWKFVIMTMCACCINFLRNLIELVRSVENNFDVFEIVVKQACKHM